MRVMPRSRARATMASAPRSARARPYPHSADPNCHVPSPMAETLVPATSTYFTTPWWRDGPLLRRHPDAAVEPDDLPVEIAVLRDVGDELAVLRRLAEPLGEEDRLAQRRALLLGQHAQEGGVEEPRGDGHDPHADGGQVAGGGQRHPDHRTLGGRIGELADLAVEGGDRRRVHDDAPLAVVQGLGPGHGARGTGHHVEGPDDVELLDELERTE